MAKTETRWFTIHKPEKYSSGERFTQIGFSNLGAAMGKLTKIGGKNLYLYLVSNSNGYDFELKVANYANWLGDPIYDGDGTKNSKDSTYRNQVKEGLKQLEEAGFIVQKYPNVYDFYEMGVETNNDICNTSFVLEQSVSNEKKVDEVNSLLQSKEKVIYLKQSVPNETKSSEKENLSQIGQSVIEHFDF